MLHALGSLTVVHVSHAPQLTFHMHVLSCNAHQTWPHLPQWLPYIHQNHGSPVLLKNVLSAKVLCNFVLVASVHGVTSILHQSLRYLANRTPCHWQEIPSIPNVAPCTLCVWATSCALVGSTQAPTQSNCWCSWSGAQLVSCPRQRHFQQTTIRTTINCIFICQYHRQENVTPSLLVAHGKSTSAEMAGAPAQSTVPTPKGTLLVAQKAFTI